MSRREEIAFAVFRRRGLPRDSQPHARRPRLRAYHDPGQRNREFRIAERSARWLGRSLELVVRPERFYRTEIEARIDSIGPGIDFRHIHVFGSMVKRFSDADVLFGGYNADSLFKTPYMGKITRGPLRTRRLSAVDPDFIRILRGKEDKGWFRADLVAEVAARRQALHRRVKGIRPTTAGNWHSLWPLGSQRITYAHYLSCLRVGPKVVEPFLFNGAYRLASIMPDGCRIHRRAFRFAFASPLGLSGWLPTGSGRIPRLGMPANMVSVSALLKLRTAIDAISNAKDTQGPWSPDHLGWTPVDPRQH